MEKKCSKCGKVKPMDQYNTNRAAKDGKLAQCKQCHSAYKKSSKVKISENSTVYFEHDPFFFFAWKPKSQTERAMT